jgi:hypothetical protein
MAENEYKNYNVINAISEYNIYDVVQFCKLLFDYLEEAIMN